jgi:FkbM family methyltransferase
MSTLTTETHSRALAHFELGKTTTAIELMRRAVAETVDPSMINDLAVMLTAAGQTSEARELLLGLCRLAPEDAGARGNLATLAVDAGRLRTRFLQLISECQAVHLADNLDTLFAPWGEELPDPTGVGARLTDALDLLDRCGVIWNRLGDDASRELFLRFFAYDVLGPAHVRLQLEPGPYRRAVIGLSAGMLERASIANGLQLPFEWQFHLYNLASAGYPVRVVGQPLPLASTYLFSQYAYRETAAGGSPRPGEVAVDAGGCWGDTALWLAHEVGEHGRVHTFEPAPKNRELLARNLELNPQLAQRIHVWPHPLGSDANARVWIDDVLAAGAHVHDNAQGYGHGEKLELRGETIDALVGCGAIERVDFLKVDVEGADVGVLAGAAETIRTQRPRLAVACYHRPDDLIRIPDLVASLGVPYRWYLQCSTMTRVDTVVFGVPDDDAPAA